MVSFGRFFIWLFMGENPPCPSVKLPTAGKALGSEIVLESVMCVVVNLFSKPEPYQGSCSSCSAKPKR